MITVMQFISPFFLFEAGENLKLYTTIAIVLRLLSENFNMQAHKERDILFESLGKHLGKCFIDFSILDESRK